MIKKIAYFIKCFNYKDFVAANKQLKYLHAFALSLLLLLVICSPIVVFIKKFSHLEQSSIVSDWANFGDFVAGTVGVIVGILNFFVLVFLTLMISSRDERRMRAGFLYESYLGISEIIDNFTNSDDHSFASREKILDQVLQFSSRFDFLFIGRQNLQLKILYIDAFRLHKSIEKLSIKGENSTLTSDENDDLTNMMRLFPKSIWDVKCYIQEIIVNE